MTKSKKTMREIFSEGRTEMRQELEKSRAGIKRDWNRLRTERTPGEEADASSGWNPTPAQRVHAALYSMFAIRTVVRLLLLLVVLAFFSSLVFNSVPAPLLLALAGLYWLGTGIHAYATGTFALSGRRVYGFLQLESVTEHKARVAAEATQKLK